MQTIKKIAVIGGTGKSGTYLIKQLIKEGTCFKALVRNTKKFTIQSPFIEVIEGDVTNYPSVRTLVDGCQAVISTLGLGRPPSEASIFSRATNNIIQSMHECNVSRYIVTTGLHVDTPLDSKGPKTRSGTDWMYANYPETTTDKQKEYDILVDSSIDWTLVRLPWIVQTDHRGAINVSLEDCPGDKISATSLAHFLIGQLANGQYIRQSPFIADV